MAAAVDVLRPLLLYEFNLRFNADKCKVLHIGRDNEHYEYYMDRDTKIGVTTNERDLGVQIDPDLKFNQQVETDKQSKQDVRHDTVTLLTPTYYNSYCNIKHTA